MTQKLGDKYNLTQPQDFDDAALSQGSLPMAVLKEVVGKWIANTRAGKLADQLPFACKPRALETCTGTNVCVRRQRLLSTLPGRRA